MYSQVGYKKDLSIRAHKLFFPSAKTNWHLSAKNHGSRTNFLTDNATELNTNDNNECKMPNKGIQTPMRTNHMRITDTSETKPFLQSPTQIAKGEKMLLLSWKEIKTNEWKFAANMDGCWGQAFWLSAAEDKNAQTST